jgi:hypothetical protein
MQRQVVVVVVFVALAVPTLAAPAAAGGRTAPPARAVPVPVKAAPELLAKTAFGSPGGFPFNGWESYHQRTIVVPSGHRSPHHGHGRRFPSTVLLYTPAALYGSPVEPPTPVVNVAPVIHASPIIYVSPTVVVPEPASVAVTPVVEPLPSLPSVVEHPTGRYELRGDGMTTPYVWAWIPNPPAAPPATPSPSSREPLAGSVTANRTRIYQWTDDEGTTSWTNRLESIPETYRSRARGPGEMAKP